MSGLFQAVPILADILCFCSSVYCRDFLPALGPKWRDRICWQRL